MEMSEGNVSAAPVLEYAGPRARAVRPAALPGEQVVFAEGTALVTDARLVIGETTFVIAQITSIRMGLQFSANVGRAVVTAGSLTLIGASLLSCVRTGVWTENLFVLGFAIFAAAGIIGFTRSSLWAKDRYALWIDTPSGQRRALSSSDPQFVLRVQDAVNRVIVRRSTPSPSLASSAD